MPYVFEEACFRFAKRLFVEYCFSKQMAGKFAVTSENGINDGVSIKRPGA